jgi:signal peptide peptidase SppA
MGAFMRNDFIVRAFQAEVWAILPEKFEQICAFLQARVNCDEAMLSELKAKVVGTNDVPRAQQIGPVAVIPVFGTVAHRMNMFSEFSGGTSTESLKAQIQKAAADESVSSIVLDVNSPGGTVGGLPELHSAIMDLRAVKPIVASINAQSASAAYWITSAASEICITPSGEAGSIGVFCAHEDLSKAAETQGVKVTIVKAGKYKAEGNQFEPLSDEAKAMLQSKVDTFYNMFVKDVAAGRGVTAKDVKGGFGEGRMLSANDAKAAGLVDRIETMDATINRLAKKVSGGNSRARAEEHLNLLSKFL